MEARDSERKPWVLRKFIFPFFLFPSLCPPSLASFSSTEEYLLPPTAMATPVEGGRGKPTLEEAPPLEELELEGKTLMGRSGFSCPPARAAPATMAGGGGKHLERTSLEQGSLAASLVAPLTVAAAVTTASLSTTTVSTATSRTREDSTTRALTRTRASTTRTTESANATTA